MTPAGVSEAEAIAWVSGMSGLFSTLESAWRAALDEALAEADSQSEGVTHTVTQLGPDAPDG